MVFFKTLVKPFLPPSDGIFSAADRRRVSKNSTESLCRGMFPSHSTTAMLAFIVPTRWIPISKA